MAKLERRCSACGEEIDVSVGQSPYTFRWWWSIDCPYCGDREEGDGGEDVPADVRAAILAAGGLWALRVEIEGESSKRDAAAALRSVLGLPIARVAELKAKLPGEVARGTRPAMEYYARGLLDQDVASRLVLIEPGLEEVAAPAALPELCVACGRRPETGGCTRCGSRVCDACRAPGHCARCAFEAVREVLGGRRVAGPSLAEAKMLRIVLQEVDVEIGPRGFVLTWPRGSSHYFPVLAPFVVQSLLDRAGIARLEGPTVATLPKGPTPRFELARDIADLCAWFVPAPEALRILLRERADGPPSPRPIPIEGPSALPDALPPRYPSPPRFREEPSPRACPRCQAASTRYRDLGDALVCLSCGRSFEP